MLTRASRQTITGAPLLALAVAAGFAAGASSPRPAPSVQSAASAEVRIAPSPVEADDGRSYLLYELHLRGLDGRRVRSIEVLGQRDGESAVIATVDGAALRRTVFDFIIDYDRRFFYDSQGRAMSFHLGGGGERMAYLTVELDGQGAIPTSLSHRVVLASGDEVETLLGGDVSVAPRPEPIGPPLRGGSWVADSTLTQTPPPHRLSLVRHLGAVGVHDRFAIDFTAADASGATRRPGVGGNEGFVAWGREVVAVADAMVVAAVDGHPDNDGDRGDRAVEISKETLGGNHVILDLGAGRYAVYAHLQQGSVRVREGAAVAAGTTLGRVGNSGNSNEPHLHFAVATAPSVISGEGLPFVFDRFSLTGTCTFGPDGWGCTAADAVPQRDRLPLQGRLIAFP